MVCFDDVRIGDSVVVRSEAMGLTYSGKVRRVFAGRAESLGRKLMVDVDDGSVIYCWEGQVAWHQAGCEESEMDTVRLETRIAGLTQEAGFWAALAGFWAALAGFWAALAGFWAALAGFWGAVLILAAAVGSIVV
jgi:hypothetical protein